MSTTGHENEIISVKGLKASLQKLKTDIIDHPIKPATSGTSGNYPYNGKGLKVIKKNITNGVNTITQDMMSVDNTIYVIKYDFVLTTTITVPDNCVLLFDGGSISGGVLKLHASNRILNNHDSVIFDNCKIEAVSDIYANPYNFDDYSISLPIFTSWFKNISDADLFRSISIFDEAYIEKDLIFNYVQSETVFWRNRKSLRIHGNGHTITTYHEISLAGSGSLFNYRVPQNADAITGCEGAVLEIDNLKIISHFVNNEQPELIWDRNDWTKTNYYWCNPITGAGGSSIALKNVDLDIYGSGIGCAGLTSMQQRITNYLILENCNIKYEFFAIEGIANTLRAVNTKFDGTGLVISGFVSATHNITFEDCVIPSGMEIDGPALLTLRGCILKEGCGYGSQDVVYRDTNLLNVFIENCRTSIPYDGNNYGYNWSIDTFMISNSVITMFGDDSDDPTYHYLYNAISAFDHSVKKLIITGSYLEYSWNLFNIQNFNLVENILINGCVVVNRNGENQIKIYVGEPSNADTFVSKATIKSLNINKFIVDTGIGPREAIPFMFGTAIPIQAGEYATVGKNKANEIVFFNNVMGASHANEKFMDKMVVYNGTKYLDAFGNDFNAKRYGETSERPTSDLIKIGYCYYDTSLNKPIWYKGDGVWIDATGIYV